MFGSRVVFGRRMGERKPRPFSLFHLWRERDDGREREREKQKERGDGESGGEMGRESGMEKDRGKDEAEEVSLLLVMHAKLYK